ncbi:MAG: Rieske (2Fe-2S) protein [Bdellovibrionota bacterium]
MSETAAATAPAAAPAQPVRPPPRKKPERILGLPPDRLSDNHIWTRRDFFSLSGWGLILGALATGGIAFLRFMFPRVLFEPDPTFKAGFPSDYPPGTVSEKYIAAQRVWIVHMPEGLIALSAICTHLGCTPRWLSGESKFKCPCHGSGFTKDGINYEGPAPRPLERWRIGLAEDGQILVDKSKKYLSEKGEWGQPGSYLPV